MTISIGHRTFHIAQSGNILLWLIAAFHMLLAAALLAVIFSVTPADAAEDNCNGKDLLSELRQNEPARYAEAVKEADATPNGKGIFWKIEKPGLKPSWLLGTMLAAATRPKAS